MFILHCTVVDTHTLCSSRTQCFVTPLGQYYTTPKRACKARHLAVKILKNLAFVSQAYDS